MNSFDGRTMDEERLYFLMLRAHRAAKREERDFNLPYVRAAVFDKNMEFVATGCRRKLPGTDRAYVHAERDAISKAQTRRNLDLTRCTIVTTLEPCGVVDPERQVLSSCSALILESGISRVV
jgi:pyrimidine deaminase RibD-like protein